MLFALRRRTVWPRYYLKCHSRESIPSVAAGITACTEGQVSTRCETCISQPTFHKVGPPFSLQ